MKGDHDCWQGEGGQDRAAYKALSAVGNAMFFTGVAAAAFFGYYTYRYSAQELEQLVNERKQPETEFPGSSASTQVTFLCVAEITSVLRRLH